jgi:hypothetical protein
VRQFNGTFHRTAINCNEMSGDALVLSAGKCYTILNYRGVYDDINVRRTWMF